MSSKSKKHVIFLGPPGCGKGTQSHHLINDLGYSYIATGDLIREEIASGTEIGLKIKKIVESGQFPSNDVIHSMVEGKIKKLIAEDKSVLFDGFPRTIEQAEFLYNLLESAGECFEVIFFELDHSVLVDRIVGRFSCAKCGHGYHKVNKPTKVDGVCDICGGNEFITRDDDREDVVVERLRTYEEKTAPIVDFFADKGVLSKINAQAPMDNVQKQIDELL